MTLQLTGVGTQITAYLMSKLHGRLEMPPEAGMQVRAGLEVTQSWTLHDSAQGYNVSPCKLFCVYERGRVVCMAPQQ